MSAKTETGFSPSNEVNHAFTSLILAYTEKLKKRGITCMQTDALAMPVDNASNRIGELVGKFPEIFTQSLSIVGINMNERIPLVSPVGEYGVEWAKAMVGGAKNLIDGACNNSRPTNITREGIEVSRMYENTLGIYTFNKTDEKTTIAEGFQSILFSAGFLTMYKVPGYDSDPNGLLADLVDQHIFSKLATAIPPGLTGLLGFRGGVFTSPTVVKNRRDKLSLNPILVQHFSRERGKAYKDATTFARERLDKSGCPLAKKLPDFDLSGIDMAAKLFAQTMNIKARP